jgi:RHS repeat-associated protein
MSPSFAHVQASRLALRIDGRGLYTTYTYDADDRLTGILYQGGDMATMTYDALSRRTRLADWTGLYTATYDPDNRLIGTVGPTAIPLTYAYDAIGQRAQLAVPTGLFSYTFDAANRLTLLINPQGDHTSYRYDPASRVTACLMANGTRASYSYDSADRLFGVANIGPGTAILPYACATYRYDPANNPIQVGRANGTVATWTYDAIHELTSEAQVGIANYIITYTYGDRGNRFLEQNGSATSTSTFDLANGLTAINPSSGSPSTYVYDGCGNLAQHLEPGQVNTYTWDGENRMTMAVLANGVVDTFTFNADGQRVGRTDTTGSVKYVWDGQNVLVETNASNVIEAVHTLEPRYFGNQVSQFRSGVASYYHYDLQGSTLHLTNAAGTLTNTYVYNAWGNPLTSSGSTFNPYQYIGRKGYIYDSDLFNYQVRARRYDPGMGRWWSRDPIGFAGGDANLYRYVGNGPTASSDPSGEFLLPVLGLLAVGGLVGANLWIWGNNAVAADDLLNNRPINPNNTPYTLRYGGGLLLSTGAGAGTAVATPIVTSILPASVSMAGGLGLSAYCTMNEGRTAVNQFRAGNYFQGTFHVGTAGLAGYGHLQFWRHGLGMAPLTAQETEAEINRYIGQGYTQAEAEYLAGPYVDGMGHHFFPRRLHLPERIQDSPFNVMKPTGISRGRFYERHYLADKHFDHINMRPGMQTWRASNSGLTRPNFMMRGIYGLPDITRGAAASAIVCTRPSPK